MRNLRNLRHDRLKLENGQRVTAAAWDAGEETLLFTTGPEADDPTVTIKQLQKDSTALDDANTVASFEAPSPRPDVPCDRILDFHAFPDTQTLTLVLAGGDIILVRTTASPEDGTSAIEIVGSVDAGISAAAWSPDETLLAIITTDSTLVLLTRDFDPLLDNTVTLSASDVNVSDHVSVGWGKKETQFKGRGAVASTKALRDPTVPERVDEGSLSFFDDGESVAISWRGDGEVFAVNAVLSHDSESLPRRRIIRVYSREGVLESVGEAVDGLEGALSWKPSGQLIAGIQRLSERIDVVFFERNGLRHGQFSLRLSEDEIKTVGSYIELKWNVDSTVLAVVMKDRVQLWTMGNYHYYLKQDIRLDATLDGWAQTVWHPENPLQLSIFAGVELRRLDYTLGVCRGSVAAPHDLGTVAVVDGATLKITPLRIANVPPPMAFDEVQLPDNALDVAIDETGKAIAVLLANDRVVLLDCDYASKPPRLATVREILEATPSSIRETAEMAFDTGAQILQTCDSQTLYMMHDRIYWRSIDDRTNNKDISDDAVDYATWTGTDTDDPSTNPTISFKWLHGGTLLIENDYQSLRIRNCTSFVVTQSHLIYTTSQHLLKFIHLHDGQLDVPADEPEKDERCRSVERGARIVTVMPSAYSVVLQMPRGNLETIYPRALVLAGIRYSLRNRDYKKAFSICRTQRVDMNILHDYLPKQFMGDVELVVSQLKKTEYVDLLLSSLSEEDVSRTIYKETLAPSEDVAVVFNGINGTSEDKEFTEKSKINRICDAFLQALQKHSDSRLQNIVTAHVCKSPPDLEAGLRLVAELRVQEAQDRLEQAIEHICFLADVNQLYETALGLYDLDVALLVAQQSQKDPREYLPYLQGLQEMSTLRMRFAIDNDLKRFSKAITHLHTLDEFNELKTYMSKHDLYSTAIDLYRYDKGRLAEIMRLYADHLLTRNRFKEAGIAYEYISDHRAAYEAFRSVGAWRECLSNAAAVPVTESELSTLAQDLSDSAEEAKEFDDAATIQLNYLNDLVSATKLWCKSHNFAEAIRQVRLHQNAALLDSVIDPGLIESSATMTELLAEMKSQLSAQIPRLRELRVKKQSDPMAFLNGGAADDGVGGGADDIPDNLSLAPTDASTSAGTFLTRYTNNSTGTLATNATRRTSKNRRREERKRARGKKGSVYEEEYLINSIARLIERLNSTGDDVGKLVEGLMRRAMRERAVAVQAAFDEVVAACRACMGEVFASGDEVESAGAALQHGGVGVNGETTARPWGGQGVLFDAMTGPRRQAPVLKAFERLGLLG